MTRDRLRARVSAFLMAAVPVVASTLLVALAIFYVQTRFASASRTIGAIWNLEEGMVVQEVLPDLPAERAGMQVGDELVEIAGQEIHDVADYDTAAARFEPGDVIPYAVERDGVRRTLHVEPGTTVDWGPLLITVLSALAIAVVGLLALFRSSGFINGRLLFLFSFLAAMEFLLPYEVIGGSPRLALMVFTGFTLVSGLQMAVELHLVTLVPQRPRWAHTHSWIIPGYYVVGLGMAAAVISADLVEYFGGSLPWTALHANLLMIGAGLPVWALAVFCLLASRAVTYPQTEGRIQAGIVLLGTLPWIAYVAVTTYLLVIREPTPDWINVGVPLVMVSFAASILVVMFREARNRKRVLVDLVDDLQGRTDRSEVYNLIGYRLDLVFHPSSAHILGVDPEHGRQLILEHSSVGPLPEPPPDLRALRDLARQLRRPFDLNRSRLETLPQSEREWLEDAGTVLVVPLVGPAVRTVGMVLMGGKKAEEPYSLYDKQLLKTLASQISVVLENLHLHDDVSRGRRAQREVVHRLLDRNVSVLEECPSCHRCFDGGQEVCPDDGEPLELTVPVERKVADRYLLERRIDRGGMGAIFEAIDLRLDRRVAVKILLEFGQSESLKRFEREARICAGLSHPNIVAVHDYGKLLGDGAFLVMELLRGKALRNFLREGKRASAQEVAGWFDQVLDALDVAHQQKIVHRDLKPSNLFLMDAGTDSGGVATRVVKILDFGLAKARDAAVDESQTFTSPGTFLGTLPYMAPEQIAGARVDPRADLFAVGVIAFEILTGRWPFEGDSRSALVHAIAHQEPRYPESWDRQRGIRPILERCLAKMASDRYAGASELRRDLVPALAKAEIRGIRAAHGPLPSRTERIEPATDSEVQRLSDAVEAEDGFFGRPAPAKGP